MSTAKFNTWLNPNGTENYKCRAWVNFNGTGTVAIRASGNVTSITDNGTGSYTVNFTTAMPDANYSWVSISGSPGVTNGVTIAAVPTTTGVPLVTLNTSFSLYDAVYVTCAVFR
jgi:hypothetical protein